MIVAETPGDIMESSAQTLVCPVNTVGTMGNGLAKTFKLRYPGLERAYQKACDQDVFKREGIWIFDVDSKLQTDRKVLCMPTKRHWKNPSKLPWIDQALAVVANHWHIVGITSLAIPAVGCGNGQLDWGNVYELIYKWLDPIELPVAIYLPQDIQPDPHFSSADAAILTEA